MEKAKAAVLALDDAGAEKEKEKQAAKIALIRADRDSIDTSDTKGQWTPLQTTAEWGSLPLTRLLIDEGADLNLVDKKGMTALHWAAFSDNAYYAPEVVKCLLDAGADCTRRSSEKTARTAMEIAEECSAAPALLAALRREPFEGLPRTRHEELERIKRKEAAELAEKRARAAAEQAAAQQSQKQRQVAAQEASQS